MTIFTETAEELYENAPCGYLSTLPNGTIVRVNQTFLAWTGYTRAGLLGGKRFQELLTTPGRIYHDTHYAPLLQMQGVVNEIAFDLRRPTQPPLPILLNSRLVKDDAGTPLLIRTTIFNATARRQYERELLLARRQAEHLAAIVQSSVDAILSVTPDGVVQSWNRGAEQLFGYGAAEAVGQPFQSLIVPPDRQHEFAQMFGAMVAGQPMHFESVRRHKDGRLVAVSISLTPHIEAPHELVSISVILRDISAAKRAEQELRRQSAELTARNRDLALRNAELDAFVYSASHDLKEPLRSIEYYSQFLYEDYAGHFDGEGRLMLQALPQMSAHLRHLLDTLLHYARLGRQALDLQPVDAQQVLDRQLQMLQIRLRETGATVRVPHPLPTVQSDPILLGELLMNLLTNAIKYNDKAEKWVEVGCVAGQDDKVTNDKVTNDKVTNDKVTMDVSVTRSPGGSPLGAVTFYVRDNGIGISPERQDEIFQIFRRLHERVAYGGGVGAGLTIAQQIVERHGGRIWLESTPTVGTTFYFTL